jgi:hypothetical protein
VTEIFREVDEDLRHERYVKLWRRYGSYLIGAAVGVVLATAGQVSWREYHTSQQLARSDSFARAMVLAADGQTQAAAVAFADLAGEAGPGYATLARFNEAALRARQGDLAAAVAIYDELADSAVTKVFRDLAVVLAVAYSLDGGDPAELSERLAPVTAADNPWRYSALELTGLLARRAGDVERGREIFTGLSEDPAAPQGIRTRAGEMLHILGG